MVQDSILPTVASIMGPAEAAYLAQSEVLYDAILGRMPVVVPRSGFTILDQHSAKLMDRYGLTLGDFQQGEDILRERIASRLVPPALATTLVDTAKTVDRAIERLRSDLAAFDPTLAAALDRSQRKIHYQLVQNRRQGRARSSAAQ